MTQDNPNENNLEVRMLKAFHGDSLLVKFTGEDDKVRNILIDTGPKPTYAHSLMLQITDIKENNQKLDLVIITHSDDDHIGGLLAWIEAYRQNPEENQNPEDFISLIWLNSATTPSYLHIEGSDASLSARQGMQLEDYLGNCNIKWERCITNEEYKRNPFDKHASFTVLSPTPSQLEGAIEKAISDREKDISTDSLLGGKEERKKSLEELLKSEVKSGKDRQVYNGSSIAFILEIHGKKMMFLADAWESCIYSCLESCTPLELDLLKVSHHGSLNNSSERLFGLIKCDNFLISAKGYAHHPNIETIAMIFRKASTNSSLNVYFSYTKAEDKCLSANDQSYVETVLKSRLIYMDDSESNKRYVSWGYPWKFDVHKGNDRNNTSLCNSFNVIGGEKEKKESTMNDLDRSKIKDDLQYNAVLVKVERGNDIVKCSGTIVKSRNDGKVAFVITARHCIQDGDRKKKIIKTYLSDLRILIGTEVNLEEKHGLVFTDADADIAVYKLNDVQDEIYSAIGDISLLELDPVDLSDRTSFVFRGFPKYKAAENSDHQGVVVYGQYRGRKGNGIEVASQDPVNAPIGHTPHSYLKGLSGAGVCISEGKMVGVITSLPTPDAILNRIIFQPLSLISEILDKCELVLKNSGDDFKDFHQTDVAAKMNKPLGFDPSVTLLQTFIPPRVRIEIKENQSFDKDNKKLSKHPVLVYKKFPAWHDEKFKDSKLILLWGKPGSGKSSAAIVILYNLNRGSEDLQENKSKTENWTGLYYDFKTIPAWDENDDALAILQRENPKLNREFFSMKSNVIIVIDGIDEREPSGDIKPNVLKFIYSLCHIKPMGTLKVLLTCRNDFIPPNSELNKIPRALYEILPYQRMEKESWVRKYEKAKVSKGYDVKPLADSAIDEIDNNKASGSPFLLAVITLFTRDADANMDSDFTTTKASKFRNVLEAALKNSYKEIVYGMTLSTDKSMKILEFVAFVSTQKEGGVSLEDIENGINWGNFFEDKNDLKCYFDSNKHGIFTSLRKGNMHFQHNVIKDWLAASYICERMDALACNFVEHSLSLGDINKAMDTLFSDSNIDFESHYENFIDLLEGYNCAYIHKLASSFIESEFQKEEFMRYYASRHNAPFRAEANALAAALYIASASLESLSKKLETNKMAMIEKLYADYLVAINILAKRTLNDQSSSANEFFINTHIFSLDNNPTLAKLIYFFNSIEIGLFRKYYFPLKHISLEKAHLIGLDLWKANLKQASLKDSNLYQANLTEAELNNADLTNAELNEACLKNAILTGAHLSGTNLTGANLTGANLTSANLTGANLTNADFSGAILNGTNFSEATLCDTKFSKDQDWNSCKWKNARILRFSDASKEFEAWARQHPDITISDSKIP